MKIKKDLKMRLNGDLVKFTISILKQFPPKSKVDLNLLINAFFIPLTLLTNE